MTELTVERIDKVFEDAKEQGEWLMALYRIAVPFFDKVKKLHNYPVASKNTVDYIWEKAIKFDKEHHPQVLAGGMWMNHGFDYDKNMPDWIVSIDDLKFDLTE